MLAWKKTAYRYGAQEDIERYAEALGIELDGAWDKKYAQQEAPQGYTETTRRVIDARGPTDWARRADIAGLRKRIETAIHKRMYIAGTSRPAHYIAQ